MVTKPRPARYTYWGRGRRREAVLASSTRHARTQRVKGRGWGWRRTYQGLDHGELEPVEHVEADHGGDATQEADGRKEARAGQREVAEVGSHKEQLRREREQGETVLRGHGQQGNGRPEAGSTPTKSTRTGTPTTRAVKAMETVGGGLFSGFLNWW
jgi:hypothetical protein